MDSIDKKYHKLESFNCWVDIENMCLYSVNAENGEPDISNPKYLSNIESNWFMNLEKDDREFISNLMNKKD